MWPFTFYCIIRERDIQLNPNCQNILPDLTWLIFDLLVFRVTCKQLNSIVNCSYISFVFFHWIRTRWSWYPSCFVHHCLFRLLFVLATALSLSFSLSRYLRIFFSSHGVLVDVVIRCITKKNMKFAISQCRHLHHCIITTGWQHDFQHLN